MTLLMPDESHTPIRIDRSGPGAARHSGVGLRSSGRTSEFGGTRLLQANGKPVRAGANARFAGLLPKGNASD